MTILSRTIRTCAALALAALLAGCATMPNGQEAAKGDPFEPFNRAMFAIHEPIDEHAFRPLAQAWVDYVPTPVQSAVQNRMPASENTRKLEHTAIVDGKAVTEEIEIEIDEADLAREIGDYAKAC